MNKIPLILIGGGGHCMACIDVIEQEDKYVIEGILDREEMIGKKILEYPVIGTDRIIPDLVQRGFYFLITVGQIKSAGIRKRIFEDLLRYQAKIATVISPRSYLSKHSFVDEGGIIMHGAVVNAGARIGLNAIVNSNALIEHEVRIGNHVHISTAAVVNGSVNIENEVFVGSHSVLCNNIEIASQAVIGAGSTVTKSITTLGIYAGSPCKVVGERVFLQKNRKY
ncbi:acetyltransferase [Dyadobacter bucti]|uniref:acetyltransferase n=1 Tax=Dyadobacter bucti TaxID=2572203 RepID=UPI003F711F57